MNSAFAKATSDGTRWLHDGQVTYRQRTERQVPVRDVAADHGLVNVHRSSACEGRGCSVHHPSDHPMRTWPMVWRFRGYFERTCPHGVGHPDPDDVAYLRSIGGPAGAHGCDGCCR